MEGQLALSELSVISWVSAVEGCSLSRVPLHMHCTLYTQSYTMRNGVLGVIGEVVGQVLNSPEMDEQAKCTRDQLLDKLEVRGW